MKIATDTDTDIEIIISTKNLELLNRQMVDYPNENNWVAGTDQNGTKRIRITVVENEKLFLF